ncbi:MAG: DUF4271 domain-containing protein [Paludibacteraceae bacterium]|nr:DUF4271 domain-containing protein [Paludibacteraceae bacterium]
MRYTGIPIPESLINNNTLISILILVSVVVLILIKQRQSLFVSSLYNLYSNNSFLTGKITISDQIQQYSLLALSLFGVSLFFAHTIQLQSLSWNGIGYLFTMLAAYFVIKLIAMQVYLRLFFGSHIKEFIYKYISLTIALGLNCFAAFILLKYAPLIPATFLYGYMLLIAITYTLSVFYILFRHFFYSFALILHLILYLCTLEIMPILIAIKWAL